MPDFLKSMRFSWRVKISFFFGIVALFSVNMVCLQGTHSSTLLKGVHVSTTSHISRLNGSVYDTFQFLSETTHQSALGVHEALQEREHNRTTSTRKHKIEFQSYSAISQTATQKVNVTLPPAEVGLSRHKVSDGDGHPNIDKAENKSNWTSKSHLVVLCLSSRPAKERRDAIRES